MKNKVYYFDIPSPENKEVESRLLNIFIEELVEPGTHYMDFADCPPDRDMFYLFLPEYRILEIIRLFGNLGIEMTFKDVTDDILNDNVNQIEFDQAFNNVRNRKLLNSFIHSNLTVDIVLDKIIKHGIESLNELDKLILKNKS